MARALYERFPAYRAAFDQCANAMRSTLDVDLVDLVLGADPGADDRLRRTEYTQPALFAVEYALARLTTSAGVAPAAFLGHSVGEYVAACLAGVFSLDDAAALVALRGRLMSRAPGGAMLAVLLAGDDARRSPATTCRSRRSTGRRPRSSRVTRTRSRASSGRSTPEAWATRDCARRMRFTRT